ncbi:hypothetical protein FPV67DRAFT_898145 [Lyophyllum atratum]|nr:hypothetical protein FPV67DRAFT_898145 [Lyophyllum atratum]
MASSTNHYSTQHTRYSHPAAQSLRDDPLRLPSIKDLNFGHYDSRRQNSQDGSPQNPTSSVAPAETSINSQDNSVRWSRSNVQPQSPTPVLAHHHHHHHQQHHQQQQHTPPLSAGHEPPQLKNDYSSKPDNGGFLTPGMPLSAQSTPVPGSVTIGPGTRGDEAPQSKRRRSSGNMSAPRDARSPHTAYAPHYASYPPGQPAQQSYHQMQPPPHPAHTTQPPLEHVHAQQVAAPPHPGYAAYPPQQYMHARVHAQQQQQPTPTNPYPSPAPVPPPQPSWEQPSHPQAPQHQHQPPSAQQQHQPHPPHISTPQHTQHPPHPSHVVTQHQQPIPPPSQHHNMHVHHQQPHPALQSIPPPVAHHSQHPQPPPQQQQAPPQLQHPQMPYARTTAIVPIDTRGHYPADDRMPSARDSTMSEVLRHFSSVFDFILPIIRLSSIARLCIASQADMLKYSKASRMFAPARKS